MIGAVYLYVFVALWTGIAFYAQHSAACPNDSGLRTVGLAIFTAWGWPALVPTIDIGGEDFRKRLVEDCNP